MFILQTCFYMGYVCGKCDMHAVDMERNNVFFQHSTYFRELPDIFLFDSLHSMMSEILVASVRCVHCTTHIHTAVVNCVPTRLLYRTFYFGFSLFSFSKLKWLPF